MLPSYRRPAVVLVALLTVFATWGCATERKPINKVQANALAKSFFVGKPGDPSDDPEFYYRNFVVDGSEAQELVGIGSWGGVDRIKWEISEKTLFGRRAYGQNQGADNKGSGPGFPNGTIIAAYTIDKHFDIKRDYNPQTGEELNVVIENDTDRPWYERDYFRVDWSQNLVDSPDWFDMFIGKIVGDLTVTPVAYYVSDPNQDDAPHFETPAGYFDVTSKFLVAPSNSVYQGIPQCALLGFLTGTAIQNCDAQEAVVRSSYWRVDQSDPNNDFEPFENTLAPQDIFGNPGGEGGSIEVGIVTPPRASYDPGYQYTDAGLKRFMHIHNIWKQSHQTLGHCTTDAECASTTGLSGSTCLSSGTCTIPCNYGARADGNADGTDDQCDKKKTHYTGSSGAQCSAKNRCTIPYRDREIKPIQWWVNTDMPDVLQDPLDSHGKPAGNALGPTEDVVFTWNQALALGVAHSREVECRRTGDGNRTACHQKFFDDGSEMLSFAGFGIEKVKDRKDVAITCHNPVRDYDAPDCGPPNTIARVGDVRRNFIFYWPFASRAPWGGIANWNADPLTGQMIGAAATVMGRSATVAAAQIRDVLMVANGELDMTDITGGTPSRLYQRTLQFGQKPTVLSSAEIARRVATIDVKNAATRIGASFAGGTTASGVSPFYDMLTHTTADPGLLSQAMAELDGIAKPLLGSQYETQLVSPSWLVDAAGLDPSSPLDDATLAQVSPLRGRDPAKTGLLFSSTLAKMGDHGVCTFAGSDGVGNPDVRGVAQWFGASDTGIYGDTALKKTYKELAHADIVALSDKRAGLIYDHLTKETYKGIALHEVGHALGMFHNFASSFDATNFDPQYWQLRTNQGASTDSCNATPRTSDTADTCMGPRFLDPETDDELGQLSLDNGGEPRPGINYFGNTSTMEYQNERFFETVGMGQYDMMTMGALYGRVLETFDPDAMQGVDQTDYQFLNFSQLVEDNLVNWTPPLGRPGVQAMHYTELARRLKLYDETRCRAATPDELNRAEWRVVHGKICSPPPKDHASWDDFVDGVPGASGIKKAQVNASAKSWASNVRWPYRFGQTNNAYVQINPSDAGADVYEVTKEAVKKFDYSYAFQYFRRQRADYNYDSIPSLTADRFFERLRSYHWAAALNNTRPPDVSDKNLAAFEASDDVWRSNALAEHEMFGALARSVILPQIGTIGAAAPSFTLGQSRPIFDALPNGQTGGSVQLDASNARFVDPDYETTAQGGGSWNYLNYINHAGFDVEKSFAAQALADPRPTLAIIQRDTYIDGRHIYINFRTDMAKGVDRMIGGIAAGDWESVAEYFPPGATDPLTLDLADDAPARSVSATNATLLFPNLGYRQQLAAVIWAQLFGRLGTELTLANKMLITLEGTVGVIDIPEADKTRFSDPRSGFTYVARLYGPDTIDGKTVDSGIGSRMIAHANDLLALAYQVERDTNGQPLLDTEGRPVLVLDAAGQPTPTTDATAAAGFADYIGLLDATVQIAARLGHGPLAGDITGPPPGP